MGTEIRSTSDPDDFGVKITGCREQVVIRSRSRTGGGTFRASRADFLAAVEAECGVIVIDRAEVPEVDPSVDHDGYLIDGEFVDVADFGDTPGVVRRWAMRVLALAEYLDAHPPTPPVDEADVETLAGLLRSRTKGWFGSDLARSLILDGVRPPEVTP